MQFDNQILSLGATEILAKNNGKSDYSGMTPSYKLLSGYDNLIIKSPGIDGLSKNGGLPETLEAIKKAIHNYNFQVKALAQHLKADNLLQSCFNIWHFCINNIAYKLDKPGVEEIRTPSRTWKDRFIGVDCDDFTIFTSSLLLQMGYIPSAAVVAFGGKPNFQHIYTVVNPSNHNGIVSGGVVVDPVITYKFNVHPENITKSLIMQVQELNGLGFSIFTINGINEIPEDAIFGLGGVIVPPTKISQRAMNMQSEIIKKALANVDKTNPEAVRKALNPYMPMLRKSRALISLNGLPEQNELSAIIPYVDDITQNGYLVFSDDDKMQTANDVIEGLGKIKWPKIKVPKIVKAAVNPLTLINPKKNIVNQLKPKAVVKNIKEGVKEVVDAGKKVVAIYKKVDPLLVLGRNSYLGLLKINYRNNARKISIGLDKADALARGYSEAEFLEYQIALQKLEAFWKKAGGDLDNLHKAIREGKNKKALFGSKDKNLKGLGVAPAVAAVAAAASFLTAATGFFKSIKPKPQDDEIDPETGEVAPPEDETNFTKILEGGKNILDAGKSIKDMFPGKKPTATNQGYNSEAEADIMQYRDLPAQSKDSPDGESSNTGLYAVLGFLGLVGVGYFVTKK